MHGKIIKVKMGNRCEFLGGMAVAGTSEEYKLWRNLASGDLYIEDSTGNCRPASSPYEFGMLFGHLEEIASLIKWDESRHMLYIPK